MSSKIKGKNTIYPNKTDRKKTYIYLEQSCVFFMLPMICGQRSLSTKIEQRKNVPKIFCISSYWGFSVIEHVVAICIKIYYQERIMTIVKFIEYILCVRHFLNISCNIIVLLPVGYCFSKTLHLSIIWTRLPYHLDTGH